jgi:glycosyltransferase 2 family protein
VSLAFLVLFARDIGYIYRIRVLTNEELSWTSSIYVILLWEFASAVTPSVVGGTAIAVFILVKERINLGKSLAYVMLTAILDNLFFVIMAPIALLLLGSRIMPEIAGLDSWLGRSLPAIFITSYSLIAIYTIIMTTALFFKPRAFKWLIIRVASLPLLRRWKYKAVQQGNEIIMASQQLRGKEASYWWKISLSTVFIWSARYVMLNCLIAAYRDIPIWDHIIVFGKNLVLWITMLFSPTPGSSGTAEYFFPKFFGPVLGQYTAAATLFWRIMSYYPYLIIGAIILPRWIRRVFFRKDRAATQQEES